MTYISSIYDSLMYRLLLTAGLFAGSSVNYLTAQTEVLLETYTVVAPHLPSGQTSCDFGPLRSAQPIDLAALLSAQMPSIAMVRKSPLAGDILVRGLSRDNLLVTVDETRTYCACPNRMDPPAFHVSTQQIESVRLRTGPFTVDEGASVGGVVAVRTNEPTVRTEARAYGYAGSFDYWAGGLTLGGNLFRREQVYETNARGGIYYQTGGVYEDGSGFLFTRLPGTNYRPEFQDRDAFTVLSAEARLRVELPRGGEMSLGYGYQDAEDILYPGLQMDALSDVMHRASVGVRLPSESILADEWSASLSFSRVEHDMRDTFRLSSQNNPAFLSRGYMMRTEAESGHLGLRLAAYRQGENDHFRYGLDLRRRTWDADNVVGPNANHMLPDVVAVTYGGWAVWESRHGPWAVESGIRLDLTTSKAEESIALVQNLQATSTNEREEILPSFYVLVSRELGEGWTVYVGPGYASRQPDPQERYVSLDRPMHHPDWVGNPDLDAVGNWETQVGVHWSCDRASIQGSVFHAWLQDLIYLQKLALPNNAKATSYTNLDARLYGFSLDGFWRVAEGLQAEAGLAWQEGVKEPKLSASRVLAEIPPLRARLALTAEWERITVRAECQFQDRLDRLDPDLNEKALDGWVTLGLKVTGRITEHIAAVVGVDNLTDATYAVANAYLRDPFSNSTIVNDPGRFWYVRVGVDY